MTEALSLFHTEEKSLNEFKEMVKSDAISKRSLVRFIDNYDDLITQSKVITRVSDRLQSKLNKANEQIAAQNATISDNNKLLHNTIEQLVKAKVSKKASTIILTAAVVLFVAEEVLLEEAINSYVDIPYIGLIVKLCIALTLKAFESTIEKFFMRREHSKIVEEGLWEELEVSSPHSPGLITSEAVPR
ncbi:MULTISPECIES: hypothetical protein [unclassified Imperialibacter]|uniref:hypothetical protein n=1 Tax=unclassified Imperialibacter TaxID=2629706 RepID=UPI0012551ECA|nr:MULTISPECIES: hypothetical protein [unclassified Imperialibacter]CAD5250766.1 conserved hypothetical protein [Imperialibacter sp. 75]CAD5285848.1 conserved hypothetical protein [Imperialibacter sp. 89]VVT05037.1 conserved hypothetical protein [Imperialibacter sp. EC-SDR9]